MTDVSAAPLGPLWIKNPLAILAKGADGGLVVQGAKIVELVGAGDKPQTKDCSVYDASDQVVLPGLVNTHHHFYQTLTRALNAAANKTLFPWLQALYPIWAGLTPQMVRLSSELAMAELLLSGCTMASDHHYLFPQGLEEAVDLQVEAARAMGLRIMVTRGSMSLSVENGGLPPKSVVQSDDVILADSARGIGQYHKAGEGAMVQIALAPCSPFSVTPELMRETAALARQHGVRLHTHLAETEDETAFCRELFGLTPLDYLESVEWLGSDVWLAHGIHFSNKDIERLGKAGCGVSHCASSNMVLSSGTCKACAMEQAGVALGLGVDGSASNDASNMMQEVRQAFLLQRLARGADTVSPRDVLRWATQGSAKCLGRDDIGRLEVGVQADIAMFKLDEPRFSGAENSIDALVICGAHKAHAVMVQGHWRVRDGTLVDIDLEALMSDHGQAARTLWAQA